MTELVAPRLVALFVAGLLLLNFPLLALWDRDATVLGLPLLSLRALRRLGRADRPHRLDRRARRER